MSDTVREQIAEIINDGTGGRVDMEQASSMSVIILSIVREAVSAVKPNYKSYDDGEMSTAAKVADDYHDALMEVLS